MGMNPRGRLRGRNHNNFNNNNNRRFNNTPNRNTVYDSIGPAGRLRGTAFQLMEKYLSAAKELMSSDRVAAENCLQHADHYMRINAMAIAAEGARFQPQNQTENENTEVENEMRTQENDRDTPQSAEEEIVETPVAAGEENTETVKPAEPDLSVPVAAMAENEKKARRGRPAVKKAPADSEKAGVPVVIKRRGRPSKNTVAAEA